MDIPEPKYAIGDIVVAENPVSKRVVGSIQSIYWMDYGGNYGLENTWFYRVSKATNLQGTEFKEDEILKLVKSGW